MNKKEKALPKDKEVIMDQLQDLILSAFGEQMLTNEEVAALLTSIMRNVMLQPANEISLKKAGMNRSMMNTELVCLTQQLWALEYLKGINKS
ncbi:hypothetical protein I6N96_03260 [Enterococcus sp. BWM-S5]|uniref:Bacteriocin immunity protein n=1 Tax=Enterococcus larvae TaxID=2794352 RepID=A0ABS4CG85_9ENTE|nr:hypothetical protein [Enterococcus larvae]MBP1045282.1 hypothetical protein [Enterococcus larvae]